MFSETRQDELIAQRNINLSPQDRVANQERYLQAYLIEESPSDLSVAVRAQGLKVVGAVAVGSYLGSLAGEAEKGAIIGGGLVVAGIGVAAVRYCFGGNSPRNPANR